MPFCEAYAALTGVTLRQGRGARVNPVSSLIGINSRKANMEEPKQMLPPAFFSSVVNRVNQHQTQLRFAVAPFDTWDDLRDALQHLSLEGIRSDVTSCLGLQRVLTDTAAIAVLPPAAVIQELPFPENLHRICCTAGQPAQCLVERLRAGAPTLKAALTHWLISRHAGQLQEAVEAGRIILWVQLFDNEGERRAYRSLLAGSSNSVSVHDLVGE